MTNYSRDSIRDTLLQLSSNEKTERMKVKYDYYFYNGAAEDMEEAKIDRLKLGQNWDSKDNLDYEVEQDIRNKIKPLLKKQARFMFSKKPDITLIGADYRNKKQLEELRIWIDDLLSKTKFWKKSKEAFLNASIKKRVMLRLIAREGYINFKYEDILNCNYDITDETLIEARFFEEDKANAIKNNDTEKIYYIHKFSYKNIEGEEETLTRPFYTKLTYKSSDLISEEEIMLDVNSIPCWLITNGGELGEEYGETDLHDLKPMQKKYNSIVTDVDEAIKFGLFGIETVIDGDKDMVNEFTVCAGAIHATKTDAQALTTGKQASIERQEFSLSNISSVDIHLQRLENDMYNVLDMPKISDLTNIPSAKAMKYLYNDLIARCEEKWSDWGSIFEDVIRYIISIADHYKLTGFKKEWENLDFSIDFAHNYPIPSDEEDRKTTAIEEVLANVRTRKSYIQEFSTEDDYEKEFKEIIRENSLLSGSEIGEFETVQETSSTDETSSKNKQDEEDEKELDKDEE